MKKLGVLLSLGLATAFGNSAFGQEGKLDFDKISDYLSAKYKDECSKADDGKERSIKCEPYVGDNVHKVPYVQIRAEESDKLAYTFTVRVRDRREIGQFDQFFLDSLGEVNEWGKSMREVLPGLHEAVDYCFKGSEISQETSCRRFDDVTEHSGVSFWGNGSSQYYGFELVVQVHKKVENPRQVTKKPLTSQETAKAAPTSAAVAPSAVADKVQKGFTGIARKGSKAWPFIVSDVKIQADGRFVASLEWTTLDAIHSINGVVKDGTLSFKEVDYIKQGGAALGCEYSGAIKENKKVTGEWGNCTDAGTFEASLR